MSKFEKNRKKLAWLFKMKGLVLWSQLMADKLGLFFIWSFLANILLRKKTIQKQFGSRMIYRQYSKVFKHAFSSEKKEKKSRQLLFFFAMGSESTYNARNFMLAYFFQNKGWNPEYLICDGVFDLCHKERLGKTRVGNRLFCQACIYGYDYVQQKSGIKIEKMSSYANGFVVTIFEVGLKIEQDLKTIEDCQNFSFDHLPIGELVKVSVLRYFYTGVLKPEYLHVYKKYLKEGVRCALLFNDYLNTHSKEIIIFWNGAGFMDRVAMEVCRKRSIPFITQESFFGNSSWIYAKNKVAIHLDYSSEYKRDKKNFSFDEAENRDLEILIRSFSGNHDFSKKTDVKQLLGMDSQQQFVVLFTNMNFDTYVLGRDQLFNNMFQWIEHTCNFWNALSKEVKLVVRAHPGELKYLTPSSDFVRNVMTSLISDTVLFVDADSPISSYDLLDQSNGVLVYSSTIGVEAMLLNKIVISAGTTFYQEFGLHPKSKAEYEFLLKNLIDGKLSANVDLNSLKHYLYYLYFRRVVQLRGFGINRLTGKDFIDETLNANELMKLNEEALNDFYNEMIYED
jgi:hypothetical protein